MLPWRANRKAAKFTSNKRWHQIT